MIFNVSASVAAEVDELISRYPQKRSASLMILHALQDHFGYLTPAAIEWTAVRLDLEPVNLLELVTFYPMFRDRPAGRFQFRVCRTLSCALAGSRAIFRHLCHTLGLDPNAFHAVQTTPDGQFSVEFVECLASCGTAPVMMINEQLHEGVTPEKASAVIADCGRRG